MIWHALLKHRSYVIVHTTVRICINFVDVKLLVGALIKGMNNYLQTLLH